MATKMTTGDEFAKLANELAAINAELEAQDSALEDAVAKLRAEHDQKVAELRDTQEAKARALQDATAALTGASLKVGVRAVPKQAGRRARGAGTSMSEDERRAKVLEMVRSAQDGKITAKQIADG